MYHMFCFCYGELPGIRRDSREASQPFKNPKEFRDTQGFQENYKIGSTFCSGLESGGPFDCNVSSRIR